MHKIKIFLAKIILLIMSLVILPIAFAAQGTIEKATASHGDGKIDTWTTYDSAGRVMVVATDQHKDGKRDHWVYYRNGKVYKREWDRNFDGKPDLRVLEENGRLIETQFDNNFDGKFEKTVKAPKKGTVIRVKTTNE